MKRELKFRACDGTSLWKYDITLHVSLGHDGIYPNEGVTLEQFTGLKDIDGKDAYDGDIVDYVDEGFRALLSISWNDNKAGFKLKNHEGGRTLFALPEVLANGRIVGNVHENAELLEGEAR